MLMIIPYRQLAAYSKGMYTSDEQAIQIGSKPVCSTT